MLEQQVTHCLTIGRRPDLLKQTLDSLCGLSLIPALAINDFGDVETSEVFSSLCPEGHLVGPEYRLGHHAAVDELYSYVNTPFIFHNEDDWRFSRTNFLNDALLLLAAEPMISCVCLRDIREVQGAHAGGSSQIFERAGVSFQRLDHCHDQWHGYTFNPHIARKDLWESLGGFSGFKKERHISRHLRAKGYFVAFLLPPACAHIGDGRSAFNKPPGPFKRLKNWLRGQ